MDWLKELGSLRTRYGPEPTAVTSLHCDLTVTPQQGPHCKMSWCPRRRRHLPGEAAGQAAVALRRVAPGPPGQSCKKNKYASKLDGR